jgi:hypothetical protein
MATTTNYGWTTPDDTALVKDGAAAIRTLGSSVDTSVKALSPGTTAGDIDYYTTSTAKARLGIGTAGQVLTVNGGATAPSWTTPSGAGWSSAATGSLTGASVTVSSLSAGRFFVVLDAVSTSTLEAIQFRLNGDTGNNYITYKQVGTSGASSWEMTFGNLTAASTYYGLAFFVDLANTAASVKPIYIGSASSYFQQQSLYYRSTSSITSMTFLLASGAFDAGTYTIWKQG